MDNPLISVIIITRNRDKLLQRCIKSVLNNTYGKIELVIFDNSCQIFRKKTKEFLSSLEFKGNIKYKYIESSPRGFAEMRQIAIDNSEGEIIMSIDDDCVAEKDAILHIARRFMSDNRIGIVGGDITNVGFKGNEKFKGRGKITINGKYEVVENPNEADVFGSANMSIRKKAFDDVGGYDLFFSGGLEEVDLALSIKRRGYKVIFDPTIKITHFYSPSRFRSKWRNMDILRLYLFFKHYMPSSFAEWIKFFRLELRILVGDIEQLIPRFRFSSEKNYFQDCTNIVQNRHKFLKYLKVFYNICLNLSKIIIARIIIPYLIYKAYKVRKVTKREYP